jgi:hypothetical protein
LTGTGKYNRATITGYPTALFKGEIIQKASGELSFDVGNIVALKHNHTDLTKGTSGGAWIANFSKNESKETNLVLSISSFIRNNQPGISFGPYLTADFNKLFNYVSKGAEDNELQP